MLAVARCAVSVKDSHINQQVLVLAFGEQWQQQVTAFGRGLNNSSSPESGSTPQK